MDEQIDCLNQDRKHDNCTNTKVSKRKKNKNIMLSVVALEQWSLTWLVPLFLNVSVLVYNTQAICVPY